MSKALGFAHCGVAAAVPAAHQQEYKKWLEQGRAGTMDWLSRDPERRSDPRLVLTEAASILVFALNYKPMSSAKFSVSAVRGQTASYAWGEDYHKVMEQKLADMSDYLHSCGGTQKYYVDAGPLLERDIAVAAGLGWCGKSNMLIHPKIGSYTLLGVILTSLELPVDEPLVNRCGLCRRCLDFCPTQAITAPHHVDARRCVAYLTIEHKGAIPLELRSLIGNRIYGCDTCIQACPWNKKAPPTSQWQWSYKKAFLEKPLEELVQISEEEWKKELAQSPIKRIKYPAFLRNVCVALGNVGTRANIAVLRPLTEHENVLIAEHAFWAISEIERREKLGEGEA